jgi:aminoglycoside 6-adenylyltransferase
MSDETYSKLIQLADEDENIRAVIMTGSRTDPDAVVDALSDYDIELYVIDQSRFSNDKWLKAVGPVLIKWPIYPEPTFRKDGITRLVLFETGTRIDFQIYPVDSLSAFACDAGYRVLIDKDGIGDNLPEPTYTAYEINKPSEEEFLELVNDFFWDSTYVAKNLKRDELFYAKFVLDKVIRFGMLQTMIEWYIGVKHGWPVRSGKCGRWFKKYLDEKTWVELESTFAGPDIEDNWRALDALFRFFRRIAKEVAETLGYTYPDEIDRKVTEYCRKVRNTQLGT